MTSPARKQTTYCGRLRLRIHKKPRVYHFQLAASSRHHLHSMPLTFHRAFTVSFSFVPFFYKFRVRAHVQTMEEAFARVAEKTHEKSETKARNGKRESPDLGPVSSEHHNNKETQAIIGHHYCHRRLSPVKGARAATIR